MMRSGTEAKRRCARVVLLRWLVVAAVVGSSASCAHRGHGPYAPADAAERDAARAERLTREAADVIERHPDKAEKLLREALTADLYHGPAHNNLGVLYLGQGKLYEAATEFEWARRLMPGHPDPRVNLAMTLERAGRVDDAIESYGSALDVAPEHLPAIQGLARLHLRAGRSDERLGGWLSDIALRGDEQWRQWARVEMARRADAD